MDLDVCQVDEECEAEPCVGEDRPPLCSHAAAMKKLRANAEARKGMSREVRFNLQSLHEAFKQQILSLQNR